MESGNPPSFRKLWQAIREVHKTVTEMRIVETPNLRVSRTARGQVLDVQPQTIQAASGIVFRGEHTATESYKKNDMVTILSGTSAGTYIAVKDPPSSEAPVPTGHPSYGIYWATLPTNQSQAVTWE